MRIKLSKRGDYVVRSAVCLASNYESPAPTKLRQVSTDMGVPRTFVSQILGDLVQAGIAQSFFGANGGYRLTRPPAEITVLEIVEAGEGPLESDTCVLGDDPCQWESVCPMHETWSAATAALRSELAHTTLATLVERDRAIVAGTYHVVGHHRNGPPGVEVSEVVNVSRPLADVTARLTGGGGWLIPHLDAAREEGEDMVLKIGPGESGLVAKTVTVHLGTPVTVEDIVAAPLRWEATCPSGLFTRLTGSLRLRPVEDDRTELTLAGRYRPPLGRAGQAIDEALLGRAARATIRSVLGRIAAALEES